MSVENLPDLAAVLDSALAGVARTHSVTAVIDDAPGQQRLRFHPRGLVTVDLFTHFGLDGVEQAAVYYGSLRALIIVRTLPTSKHVSALYLGLRGAALNFRIFRVG
jgi:hypothetical protein